MLANNNYVKAKSKGHKETGTIELQLRKYQVEVRGKVGIQYYELLADTVRPLLWLQRYWEKEYPIYQRDHHRRH